MTALLKDFSLGEGLKAGVGETVIPAVFVVSICLLGLSYFSAGLLLVARLKIFGITILSEYEKSGSAPLRLATAS